MTQEERMLILKMIQDGKITATEGADLLRALGSDRPTAPTAPAAPTAPTAPQPPTAPMAPGAPGAPAASSSNQGPASFSAAPSPGGVASRAVADAFETSRSALNDIFSNFDFSSLGSIFGWGDVFKFEETYEGQFDTAAGEIVLNLHSTNGRIDLLGWDRPGYRLTLIRKTRGRDEEHARERSRQLGKLTATSSGLTLEAERVGFGDAGLSLEAYLPKNAKYRLLAKTANGRVQVRGLNCSRCEVRTANGRVGIEGTTADDIDARTANGRVEVEALAPNLVCRTANGSIVLNAIGEIPKESFHGRYDLATSNGSIRVRLPDHGVGSAVDAHTTFGNIHVDISDFVYEAREKEVARRHVKGKTPGYDGASRAIDLLATTTNGSITVSR